MSPEILMDIGRGIAYALAGAGAVFGGLRGFRAIQKTRNGKNGNGHTAQLTTALAEYIDGRAEHKANGAVSRVTLDVGILRRDVDAMKTDASGRFDAIDEKVDSVEGKVDNLGKEVSGLQGYLRGKLGE